MSTPLIRVTELPEPPARSPDSHKGTFGRALIIGGSRGMSGAVCLSGVSALRGGAGLVGVAAPEGIAPVVAGYEPSYLTVPLAEDCSGRIRLDAKDVLRRQIEISTAVAIGPGIGQSNDLRALVRWMFLSVAKPLVLDADALNALATMTGIWPEQTSGSALPAPRILTPHPGEFSRLTGHSTKEVQSNREALAVAFAAERGVVLLLKGRETIITDGRRIAVNTTGNSGMSTGGTGDVLTGLITSLAAQGMPAFEAAQLGAHLHGLAGDLAAREWSQPGLIASDLLQYLGPAWLTITDQSQ